MESEIILLKKTIDLCDARLNDLERDNELLIYNQKN